MWNAYVPFDPHTISKHISTRWIHEQINYKFNICLQLGPHIELNYGMDKHKYQHQDSNTVEVQNEQNNDPQQYHVR